MRYSIPASATVRLDVASTNRVLRNAYFLLALTLLPTIVGAYAGAIFLLPLMAGNFFLVFIAFLAGMIGLQKVVIKNRNRPAGIGWLLFFTLFMGAFLGPMISIALNSYTNGLGIVATAAGGTAAIFFGVAGYASVTKRDFSQPSFGKKLFIGMWMAFALAMIVLFASFFVQSGLISVFSLAISSVFIIVMTGYILFTVNRTVRGGETNYIMVTMTLYIALFSIFQNLLNILMIFGGSRD